tara:strand:+ start:476 stop:2449 length:1974 start_codon:yes stop_codon:yes gene_type:complete
LQNLLYPQKSNKKYRPEIDGIRAFAVLAVILNHFNKELLPNGYLGVDIFFVISGYVITSSISGKSNKNIKDFLSDFYSRRLKRITPALTIFLIIMAICISAFCSQPSVYLKTALTASFGLSNIYLYQNSTDYFASSTELNPFTQTWSLGIEEQFYFIYPLLSWVSGFSRNTINGSKYFFVILSLLGATSLSFFVYLYNYDQPAAYFLISSRFWEIAAGCLLFLGFKNSNRFKKLITKLPSLLIFSLMSILMILPNISSPIPNITMVFLTVILLISLNKNGVLYKLLTLKWVIFIGIISYPLYLWHWGILSLSKWTVGISNQTLIPIFTLILIISFLSYRFVELPLRSISIKRNLTITLGIGLIFFSAIISFILGRPYLGKLFLGKNEPDINNPESSLNCSSYLKTPRDLIIVGDSHALKLYSVMKECLPENQLKLASIYRTAFPRVNYSNPYLISKIKNNEKNYLLKEKFMKEYNSSEFNNNKKNIIIANRNPIYFYPSSSSDNLLLKSTFWNDNYTEVINKEQVISSWISKLREFAIENPKDNIYILLPPPEVNTKNNPLSICKKEWFRKNIPSFCFKGISMQESQIARKDFHLTLKKEVKEIPNLEIFDTFESFCNKKLSTCKVQTSGKLLYIDSNHLSEEGYRLILGKLFRNLK